MFVSVTAAGMADDLLLRPSTIYLGPTVMLVAMALCSPVMAPIYARWGARLVLAFGSAAAAPGLWLLAGAEGPVSYFSAWAILGLAGAAALTTSAQVFLTEIAGERARRAIGAQMPWRLHRRSHGQSQPSAKRLSAGAAHSFSMAL